MVFIKFKYIKLLFCIFLIFNFEIIQSSCCKGGGCCCCKGNSNNNGNVSSDTKLVNPNKNITETDKDKNINLGNNKLNNKKNINKTKQELKNNKTNHKALQNNDTNVDINVYNKNNINDNNSNNKSKKITTEYNNVNMNHTINNTNENNINNINNTNPMINPMGNPIGNPMMNPIMNNINNINDINPMMNPMMNPMVNNTNHIMNPMMNPPMMINNMNPMENPMMMNTIMNNMNPVEEVKKQNITKKHANGLQNIGATCYMNATLQCLAHIKKFTYYLISHKAIIQKNSYRNKLSNAFIEVIENIWQKNSITYYAPNNFKDLISQMNPLFAGVQANDSKDLVLFILETIHNELNSAKKGNENNFEIIDQYNYEKTLQSFFNYFKENYRSVVSDIFYGMYNSRMKCHSCGIITHNIQCYSILIMPLEEVRKFKYRYQNYVTIRECFEHYQKSDYMTGQNQIYCNYCKRMSTSENNTTLIVGPQVLIINLNRGKGLQFNIKILFDEYLDISDFIYYKQGNVKYKLIGVVTHFGPSSESGHFIAFCKSFVDGNWYKYNDAIVNSSSFKEAQNTGVPYILFYEAE